VVVVSSLPAGSGGILFKGGGMSAADIAIKTVTARNWFPSNKTKAKFSLGEAPLTLFLIVAAILIYLKLASARKKVVSSPVGVAPPGQVPSGGGSPNVYVPSGPVKDTGQKEFPWPSSIPRGFVPHGNLSPQETAEGKRAFGIP
jgi:hypothetical protein